MIEPLLKGRALLAGIEAGNPGDPPRIWWLGQSGFLLRLGDRRVLLDPYLSDSLTVKYADTDKPHLRMTAIPVRPEQLKGIDVATSTHTHTDHLDGDTLVPLMRVNPEMKLLIPEANRGFVAGRLNCDPDVPVGLDSGMSVEIEGIRFHGIASAHETVERDRQGHCRYLGYVVEWDGYRVYHAGDTVWHSDLLDLLAPFDLDLALLPINGRLPTRRVAGNLWGQEAAALAHAAGAGLVVPCHFEMFTFNTVTPSAFAEACRQLDQPFRILRCGESLELKRSTIH